MIILKKSIKFSDLSNIEKAFYIIDIVLSTIMIIFIIIYIVSGNDLILNYIEPIIIGDCLANVIVNWYHKRKLAILDLFLSVSLTLMIIISYLIK